jgi:serine/threonine protein kinase
VQGQIVIEGRNIEFPDVSFLHEIAAGANAVVFAAHDKLLNRPIAIKIWNARGASRSQLESQKIANISHPLFVVTHRFGRSDTGEPFAIMEFIDGVSAKVWLKKKPPLTERLLVWSLYSRALSHLYSRGVLHGDPHLGNVLVFRNEDHGSDRDGIRIKVADTGTSAFWSSRSDFLRRESRLIVEVTSRLFHDQRIKKVLPVTKHDSPRTLVRVVTAFSTVVTYLNVDVDWDRRGSVASIIAEQVVENPVFDLDELLKYVAACPGTTTNRLINRLNETLDRKPTDDEDWPEELTEKTRASYARKRLDFMAAQ